MNYNKTCRIGMRVIVSPQHWLRPNEVGLVISRQRDGHGKWLVRFEDSYPGGGIDGDRLWLDQHDLSEMVGESDPGDSIDTAIYPDAMDSGDHVT
jgi:hypothetical protein